jgi:PPOX class probable F420-dependent enzyme
LNNNTNNKNNYHQSLKNGHYINLLTYKKNGETVSTPVWYIFEDKKIFIRTSNRSGKFKRIKNNNNVKFALCNIRGQLKGEWHNGLAKVEPNNRWVFPKINKKYGIVAHLLNILYKIKKMNIIILSIELLD